MKNIYVGIIAAAIALFALGYPANVLATTETVGDLQVTADHPLFPDSVVWYPGLTETKTVSVKNIGSIDHALYVDSGNTSGTGGLADILHFSVSYGEAEIFAAHLSDFWNNGRLAIKSLAPNEVSDIGFTASMPTDADNSYQGVHATFDLRIGFAGTPETVSVHSSTTGSTGSGCSDSKPGSAPTLLQAIAGQNQVQLVWSEGSMPVSYYLVAYGLTPGAITYGNPDIGPKGTTNYTVSNLSGNTTYYFRVRAGNGCMPGDFSNEIAATPTGPAVNETAAGFAAGVLGAATETVTPTPTPTSAPVIYIGQILGTQSQTKSLFLFFWILLLFLLVFLLWLIFRRKKPVMYQ